MDISPIAQVALLHTEMNSGFKFRPRTGIRSTEIKHDIFYIVCYDIVLREIDDQIKSVIKTSFF